MTDGERFAYRLSLALGLPTLDWLDDIGASDVAGWWAYYDSEPWGGERDDMRAEVNRVRSLGGDCEAVRPFYPYVTIEEKQTVEEQRAKLKRLADERRQAKGTAR